MSTPESRGEPSNDLSFIIPFGESYPQVSEEEKKLVAVQFNALVEDSLVKYLGGISFPDLLPLEPYSLTELYLRTDEKSSEWTVWVGSGVASPKHPRNNSGTNQPFCFLAVKHDNAKHTYLLDVGSAGIVIRTDRQKTTEEELEEEKEIIFDGYKQQLKLDGYTEEEAEDTFKSLTMRERLDILRSWDQKKYDFDQQMGLNHQPICQQEMNGLHAYIAEGAFNAFTPTFEDN